jgi:hypothetical protein
MRDDPFITAALDIIDRKVGLMHDLVQALERATEPADIANVLRTATTRFAPFRESVEVPFDAA